MSLVPVTANTVLHLPTSHIKYVDHSIYNLFYIANSALIMMIFVNEWVALIIKIYKIIFIHAACLCQCLRICKI